MPFTKTGINVQTGTETYIGVRRSFTSKLGKPYSKCQSDLKPSGNYSQRLFTFFQDLGVTYYDQKFCQRLCYQDKLIDRCNCCDLVTPRIRNASYCAKNQELLCQNEFAAEFLSSDVTQLCDNVCIQECNTQEFDVSLNMATFPTLSYLKFLSSYENTAILFPSTESQLMSFGQQGFVKIVIDYDQLYYTSIDEQAQTTLQTLFGNLGGQLGLFIGISFLSLVELLEIATQLFVVCWKHFKNKRQENSFYYRS